jgi:DNA-binding NarL/FixJ family response regulator
MKRFDYQQWGAKANAKRGPELPQTKLTPDQVRLIRINRNGKTAAQLAADFGVHHRTIEKIRSRETWSHIK